MELQFYYNVEINLEACDLEILDGKFASFNSEFFVSREICYAKAKEFILNIDDYINIDISKYNLEEYVNELLVNDIHYSHIKPGYTFENNEDTEDELSTISLTNSAGVSLCTITIIVVGINTEETPKETIH